MNYEDYIEKQLYYQKLLEWKDTIHFGRFEEGLLTLDEDKREETRQHIYKKIEADLKEAKDELEAAFNSFREEVPASD